MWLSNCDARLWKVIYRLSMGCHTASSASIWVRIPGPKTRHETRLSTQVVEPWDLYKYWGRWNSFDKTYLICIIAQVLCNHFDTPFVVFSVRRSHWVAVESGDPWSGALHTATTTATTNTSVLNYISSNIGDWTEFNKFCWGCHLHSPKLHWPPAYCCW